MVTARLWGSLSSLVLELIGGVDTFDFVEVDVVGAWPTDPEFSFEFVAEPSEVLVCDFDETGRSLLSDFVVPAPGLTFC